MYASVANGQDCVVNYHGGLTADFEGWLMGQAHGSREIQLKDPVNILSPNCRPITNGHGPGDHRLPASTLDQEEARR